MTFKTIRQALVAIPAYILISSLTPALAASGIVPVLPLLLDGESSTVTPQPGPATPRPRPIPDDAIVVTNTAELKIAMEKAKGGDFILLKDGDYGSYTTTKDYSSNVTLRSETRLGAQFAEINISKSSHIEFDGVSLSGEFKAERSSHTIVRNSKMSSAVLKFSDNAIYDNNDSRYVNFNDASYFTVSNNTIHDGSADLVHIKGNAHHFLVENNTLYDTIPSASAHSDGIQMAGNRNGTPHDFILRGNYVFDDPSTVQAGAESANKKLQGFFLADANGSDGYYNILIEENLINASNTSNSIAVLGVTRNVIIRNNTLLPTAAGSGGGIRVTQHPGGAYTDLIVTKNVADSPKYGTAPNVQGIDNIFYNLRGSQIPLNSLFNNPAAFGTWENFIPKAGSRIDFGQGYGAEKRIKQLLNSLN